MWLTLAGIILAALTALVSGTKEIIRNRTSGESSDPIEPWLSRNSFPVAQIALALIASAISITGAFKQHLTATAEHRKSLLISIASGGQKSLPEFYFYLKKLGTHSGWEGWGSEQQRARDHYKKRYDTFFAFVPSGVRDVLFGVADYEQHFPEKLVGDVDFFLGDDANEIDFYSTGVTRQLGFPPEIGLLSEQEGGWVFAVNDRDGAAAMTFRPQREWPWSLIYTDLYRSTQDHNNPIVRIVRWNVKCPVRPPAFAEAKLIVKLSTESGIKFVVPLQIKGGKCDEHNSSYVYYLRPAGDLDVTDVSLDTSMQ